MSTCCGGSRNIQRTERRGERSSSGKIGGLEESQVNRLVVVGYWVTLILNRQPASRWFTTRRRTETSVGCWNRHWSRNRWLDRWGAPWSSSANPTGNPYQFNTIGDLKKKLQTSMQEVRARRLKVKRSLRSLNLPAGNQVAWSSENTNEGKEGWTPVIWTWIGCWNNGQSRVSKDPSTEAYRA